MFGITDKKLFKLIGEQVYIRNGMGFGFISDEWLVVNKYLEVGFGRVRSGRGDWGGGFNSATDSPLKITIDKDFVIQKVETASFYNSRASIKKENYIKKKILKKIKVGKKLKIKDSLMVESFQKLFGAIPADKHMGIDLFESPHMVDYFCKRDW